MARLIVFAVKESVCPECNWDWCALPMTVQAGKHPQRVFTGVVFVDLVNLRSLDRPTPSGRMPVEIMWVDVKV